MAIESTLSKSEQSERRIIANDGEIAPGAETAANYRQLFSSPETVNDRTFLPQFELSNSELPNRNIGIAGDGKPYRQYTSGDSTTVLQQRSGWFYGADSGEKTGPLKVHVSIADARDLAQVQSVLIPALESDPELRELIVTYKTMDPQFGINGSGEGAKPTGIRQGAKGFTIYTRSAEDAAKVQQRIDQILEQNGLGLDRQIDSGNVDQIYGDSKRVGLTRDHWYKGYTETGIAGALVDKPVEDAIKRVIHADPDKLLTPDQLREAENYSGIRPYSLGYSQAGRLVYTDLHIQDDGGSGVYVGESGASNIRGGREGRPGIYSLYRSFGVDPHSAAVDDEVKSKLEVNGQPITVTAEGFIVGRKDLTADPANSVVSRDHAKIFRGPDGKIYINDHSTNGTWVNGIKIESGKDVPIKPDDRVNLGGADGPSLNDKKGNLEFYRTIDEPAFGPGGQPVGRGIIWDPIPEAVGPSIFVTPRPEPMPRGIFDPVPEPVGPNIHITPKVEPMPRGIFDPVPEPVQPGAIIAVRGSVTPSIVRVSAGGTLVLPGFTAK